MGIPNSSINNDVGAVILAGGLARRMDGRDKGLLTLCGKPMVEWALERVRPQVEKVVINANRNTDAYAKFGVDVIEDVHSGHLGPLAGLSAGMAHHETDYVFMCPCDSPFLPDVMVKRLLDSLQREKASIAVARDKDRLQPVFLLVHRSCEDSLNRFLSEGQRKIDRWFSEESLVEVEFSDFADAFRNINTEDERQAAETSLAQL